MCLLISTKRWNLRSIMFIDEAKRKGLGSLAAQEGSKMQKEYNAMELLQSMPFGINRWRILYSLVAIL